MEILQKSVLCAHNLLTDSDVRMRKWPCNQQSIWTLNAEVTGC